MFQSVNWTERRRRVTDQYGLASLNVVSSTESPPLIHRSFSLSLSHTRIPFHWSLIKSESIYNPLAIALHWSTSLEYVYKPTTQSARRVHIDIDSLISPSVCIRCVCVCVSPGFKHQLRPVYRLPFSLTSKARRLSSSINIVEFISVTRQMFVVFI